MTPACRLAPSAAVGFRFVLAFVLLNAPHWILGQWFYISRPLFNVELVLPLLVAVWSTPAAVLVLSATWGADLVVSQARSYHFTSAMEFARSAQFWNELHVDRFFTAEKLLVFLPFILFGAAALWCTPRRKVHWMTALAVVVALSLADVGNGSSMFSQRDIRVVAANIANSPTFTLLNRAWREAQQPPLGLFLDGAPATKTADAMGWAKTQPAGSILLVIVESMGLHDSVHLRDWLRDQLLNPDVAARYRLLEIQVPFRGATTSAELRELCGLYGSYRSIDLKAGTDCLPARLARDGWQTVGLHGFSGNMFDRRNWWPSVGLRQLRFAPDLALADEERCGGAFAGVCDTTLLQDAVVEASAPRRFVYALTLNSHLPLSHAPIPGDLQGPCRLASASNDVCQLTATIGVALKALGDSLARSRALPKVIVVGDHAPPFSVLQDRRQYDPARVPAFILTPSHPDTANWRSFQSAIVPTQAVDR